MFPTRIIALSHLLNRSLRCFGTKSRIRTYEWKDFDEVDVKNHVANIFLCDQKDADRLVDAIKDAFEADRSGRIEILRALKLKGLSIKNVSHCKCALKQPYETVMERMKFTSHVLKDESPSTIMSVLRLCDRDFQVAKEILTDDSQKVVELASLLEKSKLETSLLFIKYPFIIRSRISTLKNKVNLLLENNMQVADIAKDLWVLTYTLKRLQERVEEIQGLGIHPIKPWMLRCLPEIIKRTYQYRHENQEALGSHPNLSSYLSERLGLTEKDIKIFASKHPPVMRVHVAKMKEIIDYLMSEGYTAAKISQTPRILCHSLKTIQERINALKQKNYSPKVLSVLCKSSRGFADFLKKIDNARNLPVDESSVKQCHNHNASAD